MVDTGRRRAHSLYMNSNDKNPGPDPDRLDVEEEDWQEAVKKALKKEKPPEGWP